MKMDTTRKSIASKTFDSQCLGLTLTLDTGKELHISSPQIRPRLSWHFLCTYSRKSSLTEIYAVVSNAGTGDFCRACW